MEKSSPNPAKSFRPVFWINEKENDQELLNLVILKTDNAGTNLNKNGININYKNQTINLHIDIKDKKKDLK